MTISYSSLDPEAARPALSVGTAVAPEWRSPESPQEAIQNAADAVIRAFGVTRDELLGRSRPERIVRARQAWYMLTLELSSLCPYELGAWIGRNHGTIRAGIIATRARIDTIPAVCAMYAAARRHAGLTQ
ncbi:MAG: hypothetical protein KF791_08510 [Verrucomicrobiae bacterium]|nr:hypothetical protein [Verrucomicrobiae bacterium]